MDEIKINKLIYIKKRVKLAIYINMLIDFLKLNNIFFLKLFY